jgi:hypothetical protein
VRGRDKNKPIVDKPKKEKTKKEVKNLDDAIKKQKDFLSGFVKKE